MWTPQQCPDTGFFYFFCSRTNQQNIAPVHHPPTLFIYLFIYFSFLPKKGKRHGNRKMQSHEYTWRLQKVRETRFSRCLFHPPSSCQIWDDKQTPKLYLFTFKNSRTVPYETPSRSLSDRSNFAEVWTENTISGQVTPHIRSSNTFIILVWDIPSKF